MTTEQYRERLILPEHPEGDEVEFCTASGLVVARGYERVVIGGRGPYVEFSDQQIAMENLHVPADQRWRFSYAKCYYCEYRSSDEVNVKVYRQRRPVSYADYIPGMWYISPFDLVSDRFPVMVEQLPKKVKK